MKKICYSWILGCFALSVSSTTMARCDVADTITTPIVVNNVRLEDVRAAVVQGGMAKGWTVVGESEGKMTLKYVKGNVHVAACDVIYSTKQYTIRINKQTTLTRNCGKGEVHHKYNQWVRNLNKHINAKLQTRGR